MSDLLMTLLAKDDASRVFGDFAGVAMRAGMAIKEMSVAAMQAEKAERQLERVAGDATDALKAQAGVLRDTLGVEDEMIMRMQTLALRFEAQPDQIDAATRAVLDYASATGKNAESAMQSLLKAVENGGQGLQRFGIQIEATGDVTKDLAAATEALAKKYAGASETDAKTLEGSLNRASTQVGELKEEFGKLFNTVASRSGIVDDFAEGIRTIRLLLFSGDATLKAAQGGTSLWDRLVQLGSVTTWQGLASGKFTDYANDVLAEEASASAVSMGGSIQGRQATHMSIFGDKKTTAEGKSLKGGGLTDEERERYALRREAIMRETMKGEDEVDEHAEEYDKKQADRREDELRKQEEYTAKWLEKSNDQLNDAWEIQDKAQAKQHEALIKSAEDFALQQDREFAATQERWLNFGLQIGTMLVRGIFDVISASNEEGADVWTKVGETVGAVFEGVVGIVLNAVGMGGFYSAYQGVASTAKGAFGQTTMHSGGMVGRYHRGGWPPLMPGETPIIAQEGERVSSRAEIAANGGAAAFERMVRGGGGGRGNPVYVQAVDSSSFQNLLENRGGVGFRNTLRTGRGQLPQIFGVL